MIRKYQKKPVVIEAVQWDGTAESANECVEFTQHHGYFTAGSNVMKIETLEGIMEAQLGDFIIKGVKGEFYPCKPDIFEQTYQEVIDLRSVSSEDLPDILQTAMADRERRGKHEPRTKKEAQPEEV